MRMTPRSPEDRKRVLELSERGMSGKEIARHLGIPPSTVRRWIFQGASRIEDTQSFMDLRGRTSYEVSDPALRLALSGAWR